jgi:hypothetical protein
VQQLPITHYPLPTTNYQPPTTNSHLQYLFTESTKYYRDMPIYKIASPQLGKNRKRGLLKSIARQRRISSLCLKG